MEIQRGHHGFQSIVSARADVARYVEIIEILAGENVPVAVEKCAAQVRRQRGERLQIILIGGVDGIVGDARGDEIVIGGIVALRIFHSGGGLLINPQRLHPGVADVAGIRGAGHVRKRSARSGSDCGW